MYYEQEPSTQVIFTFPLFDQSFLLTWTSESL